MGLFVVTVVGRDRPGIVAETTTALVETGGNLEDSTMTLLGGQFAMMLLVRTVATEAEVSRALAGLTADGLLSVDIKSSVPAAASELVGLPYVLSVHGADQPGIVGALTQLIARSGGTITDLNTRLADQLYLLVAELRLPPDVDADALRTELSAAARRLQVTASLRPCETDEL